VELTEDFDYENENFNFTCDFDGVDGTRSIVFGRFDDTSNECHQQFSFNLDYESLHERTIFHDQLSVPDNWGHFADGFREDK
jgi:hypothetical protein